jgi:hypothetical protein
MLLRRARDDIPASTARAVERDGTEGVRTCEEIRKGGEFFVSIRTLTARIGLLGLAALVLLGGGFGAAGLAHATAAGATSGGPSPPPHPNV